MRTSGHYRATLLLAALSAALPVALDDQASRLYRSDFSERRLRRQAAASPVAIRLHANPRCPDRRTTGLS